MSNYDKYISEALDLGFSYAVRLEDFQIVCEADIRAYCNADQCRNYGSTWVCPPGCGTVEECQERADNYRTGIVLQTVGSIPLVGMEAKLHSLQKAHNKKFLKLADAARRKGLDILPLTTGGCPICPSCTFPRDPCRSPDRKMHSLSAYGINVGKLCEAAGLEYSLTRQFQ